MKIVSLASVRGAPGVTTATLLLASTLDDAVVVEADIDGGVLAVRYGLGREPGLTTLAAAAAEDPEEWRTHAQDAGGVPVLVGPDSPSASAALWHSAGERITNLLGASAGVAVVDVGRLRTPTPIIMASDMVLLMACPVADQLVALAHVAPRLRQAVRGAVHVLLVGDGPYGPRDAERFLDAPVLGQLPDDRRAATILRDGGRSRSRLARSPLARAVTALGADVSTALNTAPEVLTR